MNLSNIGNSTKMFIFLLMNHEPLIQKGVTLKRQYLENTVVVLKIPILMFPDMFSLILARGVKHYRAGDSFQSIYFLLFPQL